MADPVPARLIATEQGAYRVEGLDRFAIGGDLTLEVAAAVARHHARFGVAPKAVVWDDAVLDFTPRDLSFGLTRVFVPAGDPYIAASLENAGRAAIQADPASPDRARTNDLRATPLAPDAIAHTPALARLVGWPGAAPVMSVPAPRPARTASSISVVITDRDKARATMACLLALRRQQVHAALEIILVADPSNARERLVVEATCNALFGQTPRVSLRHVAIDALLGPGARRDAAAEIARGEVLVMLSSDCVLLDPGTLQTIADWALEPGAGAAGPRLLGADGLVGRGAGVQDTQIPYLSEMVRFTDGVGFACAAIARTMWQRLGATNAGSLPLEDNADLARRLSAAGTAGLHIGTHRARYVASEHERRPLPAPDVSDTVHAARHPLGSDAPRDPFAARITDLPTFDDESAEILCDYVRLYGRALELRASGATLSDPLAAAFRALEAAAATAGGVGETADYFARIDAALRHVCATFLADASLDQASERDRESLARLPEAMRIVSARITRGAQADASPRGVPAGNAADHATTNGAEAGEPPAAADAADAAAVIASMPSIAAPDPDPERTFVSHSDASFATAPHRLLVFADALGASPQILFLEGLAEARAEGRAAVRVVTEEDLLSLRSLRGADHAGDWLRATVAHVRPTAIVFSRFAALDAYRAIQAATADLTQVPRLCHIDDDFFTLPAVIGIDRYREGRHPRRIHCLTLIAAEADLILASTVPLAERLAASFGASRIGLCAMSEGGMPSGAPPAAVAPTIGYFGSATHNRDLEMIAPALRQVKADRPQVRIEIVGSVAKLSAAAALGDMVVRRRTLEGDYAAFRLNMRGWGWRIGLAPLLAHPFNAAKTPIKWTEYAQAGIPVIASRTEPYLALGRQGALVLASPDEWHGRIVGLLDSEAESRALVAAADRLLGSFGGWRRTGDRLLGLLERAAARRTLARRAA